MANRTFFEAAVEEPLNFFKNITSGVNGYLSIPDLDLWIYVVVSVFFGLLFNLLVLRSILRMRSNGKFSGISHELYRVNKRPVAEGRDVILTVATIHNSMVESKSGA